MEKWSISAGVVAPRVVGERLVSLGHLVDVVTLLDDATLTEERIDDFGGNGGGHAHTVARGRILGRPAKRERKLTIGSDRHRNRVGRTTDTAGLDLDLGLHVVDRGRKNLEGLGESLIVLGELGGILLDSFLDLLDGAVNDLLGGGLLTILHDHADHVSDELRVELRVERNALDDFSSSSGHGLLCLLLLALHTVLRTAAVTTVYTEGVELTTNDVVTHTRKVLYTAAANENDGVFLKVVAFTGNIGGDFVTGRKTHTGNLTQRGVRLLRGHRLNDETYAAALRASLERRRFRMLGEGLTSLADELIDCWH